jgi:hypothetical protein
MSKIKLVSVEADTARPTVDDAKRVQRLVEHLQELRKHRDLLAHKRAGASAVHVRIYISDQELPPSFPPDARRGRHEAYSNGFHYNYDSRCREWFVAHSLHHGTMDGNSWTTGRLPTIDTRVMDGVRAAVADEIEATESAITALGFAVPRGGAQ